MNEKPRVNKTKQELVEDLKKNSAFTLKMAFVRDTLYPTLLKANPTIEDSSTWLSGFNSALMQAFLGKMKEVKMKDLNLGLKLDAGNDNFLAFQEIVTLFDDMSVFDAKDHIEGLRGEIEIWKADEEHNRPLADLKTKWLDEI